MSVFNGRRDLYAKRWTSNKTGKSGYSPVCKNEFSTYKCDKFNVKCSECVNRVLEPLTEDVIIKHLKGEITIGIYPMLLGNMCNFLAIDFDKKTYESDVNSLWSVCDELNIPIYVERSRSGNGVHVWIFFEEPVLEVDDDEIPKKEIAKNIIFENDIECILDNQIYVKKLKLLPNERTYLKRLASFTNPKFYELQKLRMPIYNTPRIISCFEEDDRFLILPRGCLDKIQEICEKSNVSLKIKDKRESGKETDYLFNGKLYL